MKIGIDLDGVLADFVSAYWKLMPLSVQAKVSLPDPTFPPCWDFDIHFGATIAEREATAREIAMSPMFWQYLNALPNTKVDIARLDLLQHTHDVYFITNRIGDSAKRQSEEWLRMQGMSRSTVLVAADKPPIIHGLQLHAFIDDRPATLEAIATSTTATAFCFDRPYNRSVTTSIPRVQSVSEMLDMLGI